MPVQEQDNIINSSEQIEFRQVRIGDKVPTSGGRDRPNKLDAPIITFPTRVKVDKKQYEAHSKDEELMGVIRKSAGFKEGGDLRFVPVRFTTDNIDEILSVYRGMFRANHKALCFSILGDPKATRWFDTREKLGNNKLVILKEPEKVDCNDKCPWWDDKACGWRGRVSMQLEDRPWIVAATRFRTAGWYVIKYLRASLNRLAAITEGTLANIPLVLVEYQKDSVLKETGKIQTHPVMVFDFLGTLDQLRDAAIKELNSRRRLRLAKEGKPVDLPESIDQARLTMRPMAATPAVDDLAGPAGEPGEVVQAGDDDDFVAFDGVDVEVPSAPTAPPPTADEAAKADALETEIAQLAAHMELTDRAIHALFDKHDGALDAVVQDLRSQAGDKAKPVNAPTQTTSAPPSTSAAVTPASDVLDDLEWGPGMESDEPSEIPVPSDKKEEKQESVVTPSGATVSKATAPPADPGMQTDPDLTDAFEAFEP